MRRNIGLVLLGLSLGTLFWISVFEWVHLQLEVTGDKDFCSWVMRTTERVVGMDATHSIKIVYKLFALPIKTITIYSDPAHHDEFMVQIGGQQLFGTFESFYKDE